MYKATQKLIYNNQFTHTVLGPDTKGGATGLSLKRQLSKIIAT